LSNPIFVAVKGLNVSVMSIVAKDGIFANINSFFIVANPPHLDVGRAQSATSQITLTSLNSFSGKVALTTTVAASGTGPTTSPSASLSPNNVTLAASGTSVPTLRISTTNSTNFGDYNVNITGTSGTIKQSIQISVSVTDLSPVANFTFSPSIPTVGETVNFDGTSSFDPDGSIRNWVWDFGDFSGIGFIGPKVAHSYTRAGTYVVSLEVTDNASLTGRIIRGIIVVGVAHDVAVSSIDVSSRIVISSELVNIVVRLQNNGLFNETVSLSVYYDSHIIVSLGGILLPVPSSTCIFCQFGVSVPIAWDTSGVPPGNYTISATVFLAPDQNPSNNRMVDGNVVILPAPVLRVTPSTGVLGTKVLVQGHGFPVPRFFTNGIGGVVEVTFDDMFMGFAFTNNGQFNFTLNVPHADPGVHQIKAIDLANLARASVNLQALESPSSEALIVRVNLGNIYFPGDTAVVYVATGVNGVPIAPAKLLLQVLLVKPDGSNTTLPMNALAPGVFKGSFAVPSSVGTYSVRAIARMTGPVVSSAFRSFEVKPAWLSPRAQMVMLAAGLTGLIALATIVWRKDIIARRRDN
jgi:PKD repeat protein